MAHERDYLERTIATVRNHRDADNCWPQWANIFADEIERLWKIEEAAENWLDDVEEIRSRERAEWALVETEWGRAWLGFGGGFNHEDDLRDALGRRATHSQGPPQ